MDTVDLAQYAIRGTDADWEAATKRSKAAQGGGGGGGTVSIKTKVNTEQTWSASRIHTTRTAKVADTGFSKRTRQLYARGNLTQRSPSVRHNLLIVVP